MGTQSLDAAAPLQFELEIVAPRDSAVVVVLDTCVSAAELADTLSHLATGNQEALRTRQLQELAWGNALRDSINRKVLQLLEERSRATGRGSAPRARDAEACLPWSITIYDEDRRRELTHRVSLIERKEVQGPKTKIHWWQFGGVRPRRLQEIVRPERYIIVEPGIHRTLHLRAALVPDPLLLHRRHATQIQWIAFPKLGDDPFRCWKALSFRKYCPSSLLANDPEQKLRRAGFPERLTISELWTTSRNTFVNYRIAPVAGLLLIGGIWIVAKS